MRKTFIFAQIFFVVLLFCSCDKKTDVLTEKNLTKIFIQNDFAVVVEEFPASRSESIPTHSEIKILKTDEEEIFVYEYKNENEVEKALKNDFDNVKDTVVHKKNVILLYIGSNAKLLGVLQNEFENE